VTGPGFESRSGPLFCTFGIGRNIPLDLSELPPKFGHMVIMGSLRYELYLHQNLFLFYQTTWNRFGEVQLPYPASQNNFATCVVDRKQKYFSACGRLASGYSAPNANAHSAFCSQSPRYYSGYHRAFISDIFCAISAAGGGCMNLCVAQCKQTPKCFLLHLPLSKNCYKNIFSIPGTGIPFCPHLCTRIKIALRSTIFW
jgi:hypothetical protein